MENFEFLRHITIGQYLPTGSSLHRLDPRVKLVAFTILCGAFILGSGPAGIFLGLIVLLGLIALASIPLRYALQGLRPALPWLLLLAVLQLFMVRPSAQSDVIWSWGFLSLTIGGVQMAVVTLGRFGALILLVSLLTFSTDITSLTHGAESLLRPFQRIGLPAHELALVATIALRYVSLLARQMEQVVKAQASRGADFGRGHGGLIQRVRQIFPLLIPLFLTSLERAEALVLAMETRCYTGGRGRSHLIRLRSRPTDYAALGIALLLTLAIVGVDRWLLQPNLGSWLAHFYR